MQNTEYNFEIIVVDNNSTSIDTLKSEFQSINWLSNEILNPYVSRNLGIEKALGEFIGLLDAKCKPSPTWLQTGLTKLKRGSISIIAGAYNVIPATSSGKDLVYGLLYLNNQKNVLKGYGVTTGNLLIRKSVFTEIGLFNRKFVSGNDIEWTQRALKSGYKIIYFPETSVEYAGQSFDQMCDSVKKYMTGITAQNGSTLQHISSIFKYLLPMRIKNFKEALQYRNLDKLSWKNKCYLWLLVWNMKSRMALAYAQNLIK